MRLASLPSAAGSRGSVGTAPGRRRLGLSELADRFVGSDPGLNRFRSAAQSVLTIGAILAAEGLFVHLTHALQLRPAGALPAAAAAKLAMANHEYLVIAMMLGAIVGMISGFGVTETSASGQLKTMLFLPVPMMATLALGLAIGGHRVAALSSFAVVLSVGTYLRRFGPRGFVTGTLLFMGDFFGFFLHGAVVASDLGWLAAELGVGVLVGLIVRFGLFYPRPARALARTQRSFDARARKVAALALAVFDDPRPGAAQRRRLQRRLVRLNEAALMIDAQLGDAGALADGSSGQLLHQRLFDVELALTNVARFAHAMSALELPTEQQGQVRLALRAVVAGDRPGATAHARVLLEQVRRAEPFPARVDRTATVLVHRFAGSVIDLAAALTDWAKLGVGAESEQPAFQPSVLLFGGWLPGSAEVSADASVESGQRFWDRIVLAPYTRTAIQMGVAVGAAVALGDVVSGRRFYWAVIAAFITFMGANNAGEQVRKAAFRVAGTLVGIVIGSLLVDLVGHDTGWSLAVILVSLFFGFYLMRVNYAFMVVGITVTVSQLYVQLDEFSNSLLLLRLEETALGAAVAITVGVLVLPLRTRRVLRVALRAHVAAVAELVEHAVALLLGAEAPAGGLRADARAVDATFQALVATSVPLRRGLFAAVDESSAAAMRSASAARNYARNLVTDVTVAGRLDPASRSDLERGSATLSRSLAVLVAAFNGPRDGVYTRSAALFDRAERRLEGPAMTQGAQFAVRDLTLIDGTMAALAQNLGLAVHDHDTTRVEGSGLQATRG